MWRNLQKSNPFDNLNKYCPEIRENLGFRGEISPKALMRTSQIRAPF
jgi:hypothetical protein